MNTARTNFANQYNELRNQIDKLAQDASFNGVNLLFGGSLKVLFNETGTSSLTIAGVTFNSTGLGLTVQSGAAFQSNANIDTVIASLDNGVTLLRTQAANFGSTLTTVQARQEFTVRLTVQVMNYLHSGGHRLFL